MNFIKKKLKGHKKDDEEEEYEKAVYEQSLHPQNQDQKNKNTEEWQFFNQLSMKVQDTVQKTQTTLNKLKDTRPEDDEDDDDLDSAVPKTIPPYSATKIPKAPPRPPPPSGGQTDFDFGSEFSSLPRGPPRPPPPGSSETFSLDSSALHGTPSKSYGSPARPPPPSMGRTDPNPVADPYAPLTKPTPPVMNTTANNNAVLNLLDEFGFQSDPAPVSTNAANMQDLLFLDDKEDIDPFDTSYVDVNNLTSMPMVSDIKNSTSNGKGPEKNFNPFSGFSKQTDDWMASPSSNTDSKKTATNPFFSGITEDTKSVTGQNAPSFNPFAIKEPITSKEEDDFFGITIEPIKTEELPNTFEMEKHPHEFVNSGFCINDIEPVDNILGKLPNDHNVVSNSVHRDSIKSLTSGMNVWDSDKSKDSNIFQCDHPMESEILDKPLEANSIWDSDSHTGDILQPATFSQKEDISKVMDIEEETVIDWGTSGGVFGNGNANESSPNIENSSVTSDAKPDNEITPTKEVSISSPEVAITQLNEAAITPQRKMSETSDTAISPQRKLSETNDTAIIPQRNLSQTNEAADIPQRKMSVTNEAAGIPQRKMSTTNEAAGIPQRKMSATNEAAGIPQRKMSATNEAAGIPQRKMSATNEAAGIPQRKMSATNEAAGIPQRKMSQTNGAAAIPPRRMSRTNEAAMVPQRKMSQTSETAVIPPRKMSQTNEPALNSRKLSSTSIKGSSRDITPDVSDSNLSEKVESIPKESPEEKSPEKPVIENVSKPFTEDFSKPFAEDFSKPFGNEQQGFSFQTKSDDQKQDPEFDAFAAKFENAKDSQGPDPFDAFMNKRAPTLKKIQENYRAFDSMDEFDPFRASNRPPAEPQPMMKKEPSRDSFEDYDNEVDFSVVIKPKVKDSSEIKVCTMEPPKLLPPPKTPTKAFENSPASRFNPFDKDFLESGEVAKATESAYETVEIEEEPVPALGEAGVRKSDSIESPLTPLFDEDTSQPLEVFPVPFEREGWDMVLRQPNKKKLTGNRFWKKIFVKVSENSVLQLFNKSDDKVPFQELPLQACYSLSEVGAQQYDQFGKIFTVKLQYKFYRERVGVRPGQISKVTQGQVTTMGDVAKLGLPLQHSAQTSQLLKLGSQSYKDLQFFIREVEDVIFRMSVHRDRVLTYKTEEVQVIAQDEFYVEQSKTGHIDKQLARVRIFFLAFITGMPSVEVGLNDIIRQGKEVVGRYDIMPVVTEEWIRLEDVEFHSCIIQDEFYKSRAIKFHPPDACLFELLRFRIRPPKNRELPLQVRVFMTVSNTRVEIRSDILVPGYSSRKQGQVPCENIQIRFPVPECWIYLFRTEKHFRYGSKKSTARRPGKIKGLERIIGAAQNLDPSLIEVSAGQAKYEHVFHAVVWRIPRLPKEGQGAYTQQLFLLRTELTSFDQIPESFEQYVDVEFTMPATYVSHTTVRSVSVTNPIPPEKYVRYVSKHEYKVEIDFKNSTDEMDSLMATPSASVPISTTPAVQESTEDEDKDDDSD